MLHSREFIAADADAASASAAAASPATATANANATRPAGHTARLYELDAGDHYGIYQLLNELLGSQMSASNYDEYVLWAMWPVLEIFNY